MDTNDFYIKVRVLNFRILAYIVYYLSIYIIISQSIELIICAIIVWAIRTPKWVFTEAPSDEVPFTDEERCNERTNILLFSFIADLHLSISAWASQGDWKMFLIFELFMYLLDFMISPAIEKIMKYCGLCFD